MLTVATPSEPESTYREVKSGDTLSKIAKEAYGDANAYMKIFEANKPMLSNPDKIYPGQMLRIPAQVMMPEDAVSENAVVAAKPTPTPERGGRSSRPRSPSWIDDYAPSMGAALVVLHGVLARAAAADRDLDRRPGVRRATRRAARSSASCAG